MSTLEQLVPPLELCQQIPQGAFADSVLVWEVYHYQYKIDPYVISRETSETTRGESVESVYPAPAPEEIMAVLPIGTIIQQDEPGVWVGIVNAGAPGIMIEKSDKPSTAALRLWFRVKGASC